MFSERWLSSETGSCAVPAFKSRSDASVDTIGNVICTSHAVSSSSLLSQTVSMGSWRVGFFFYVTPISASVPRKLSAGRGQGSNFFPVLLVISQMAVSSLRLLFDGKLLLSPACSPRLVCVGVSGGRCCWVMFSVRIRRYFPIRIIPLFLWQSATPVIVGWFAGRNSKWYT